MTRILLTAIICAAASTEAFSPIAKSAVGNRVGNTQLDATNKDIINVESIAKAAVASALSFSLFFGPSPALADGMSLGYCFHHFCCHCYCLITCYDTKHISSNVSFI
jgi:hypothetical protein